MGVRLLATPMGRHARLTGWDRMLIGLRSSATIYWILLLATGFTLLGVAVGITLSQVMT